MSQVNKYLYHTFDHWFRGGNIWIYSDPHFADLEMIGKRKNYISDEEQVKRINSKVGKNDTIIFLGDLHGDDTKYPGSKAKALELIKKIKGYKVLITGNHDLGKSNYERKVDEFIHMPKCPKCGSFDVNDGSTHIYSEHWYMSCNKCSYSEELGEWQRSKADNHLFDEVYPGPIMIATKVMLSHEPIDCPYFFSIHGHDHSNWFNNGHHFNACAECIDYTPVSLLNMFKKGMFKNVDDIHRMTIDKATERKNKRDL